MKLLVFILSTQLFVFRAEFSSDVCWRQTYGNGIGSIPTVCPDGLEQSGLLCYPKCGEGFYGVGPVCWQTCPANYSDTGAFCQIWPHIYGKGCCCTVFSKSCCDICLTGYTDDGCTCRKNGNTVVKSSYGRGVGFVRRINCTDDLIEVAGLCYRPCRKSYDNAGPLCWKQCSGVFGTTCGALCAVSTNACYRFQLLQALNKYDKNIGLCESIGSTD